MELDKDILIKVMEARYIQALSENIQLEAYVKMLEAQIIELQKPSEDDNGDD